MSANKSRISRLAPAFALSLAALAAGINSASAESVIKWLHTNIDPDQVAAWQEIASKYEAIHPDVKIEFQFLENEAFKAKLPTLLQSSDAPSVFYTWGGGVLKAQSETGAIRDVTAALDADDNAWRKTLTPAAIDAMSFGGKVWAVPTDVGLVSFFFNKELFAQAGIDTASIQTWDDFLGAVQKLKDAGITPIAAGGGEKWPLHFYWSYLAMRELGKNGFDAAKNGEGFLGQGFLDASQKLIDLGKLDPFQKGYLGATWPDAQAAFADGRAAILLGFQNTATPMNQALTATDDKGLSQDQIGRFAFPAVEGTPGLVTDDFGGTNGWVVTAVAPPETEDFLKFYTNLENSTFLVEKNKVLPTTIGAEVGVEDPSLLDSVKQMAKATWHQNYLDQDLGPNVGRVVNDISVELVAGQMSAEDAVQQIQDAFSLEN